jgi:uncharacterized protein YecT (DUF1311 family)
MKDLVVKLGVSVLTACAGGTAWIVAEPGARSMAKDFLGIESTEASPTSAGVAQTGALDLTPDPAAKPSFNCADASSTIEKLICSDAAIAEADRQLGRLWGTLQDQSKITEEVKMGQRQWLATRDACLIADDPKACVRRVMLERIQVLGAL